jgi:anti-sigma regulatory factor (Ser/Thr protein kinase)
MRKIVSCRTTSDGAPVLLGELQLPIEHEAVHLAREFVDLLLNAWFIIDRDNAKLCVSELAANVTTHVHDDVDPTMRIVVKRVQGRVRIEVHDPSPEIPVLRHTDLMSESGNGLFLVDAVAAAWGYLPTGEGKLVWFELY